MHCWCTKNETDNTTAIDDAEARLSDLETSIEELTALSARLTNEIATLEEEIAKNQKAVETATAMRKKEVAEFIQEETDSLATISSLGGAITALSKHHEALLQKSSKSQLAHVAGVMKKAMAENSKRLEGVLSQSQKKVLSLIQSPDDANLLQDDQPASAGSYAPASGEILGVLKQMKETFETDLAAAQKDERKNQVAYEELKAAKEAEIEAGQDQVETKTEELATADTKLSEDKQDTIDTTNGMNADAKFLKNLKEKCGMVDKEYEERLKTRQLEIQAVSKAMGVLTSDDAADTFSSTFSLVQKESTTKKITSKRRTEASQLLQDVARKTNNPRLMTLATRVRLDAFTKVKKAIDDMIAELMKQKEDEIKQKDYCVDTFNENEKMTNQKTREKTDLEELIEDLTGKIDELTKSIDMLKTEIGELQVAMKRAGEDRDREAKEFQQTVADQRATQVLLGKALDVLKGFYGFTQTSSSSSAEADQNAPAGPPPPPSFKAYKKNAASGGVMGMIKQIINDAVAMEAEAIKSETDSLAAYGVFVTDTNASIEEKSKDIVNKSEEKATTEAKRTETEEQKAKVLEELDGLEQENEDLHKACDYILKNFDIRQVARDEEVEALKQAKAILSGSKFGEFLQNNRNFRH